MGQQIIRQPNGLYAVFSSISDGFLITDAKADEVIQHFVDEAAQKAREQAQAKLDQIDSGEKAYHQFTMTWEEALQDHNETFPDDQVSIKEDPRCGRCGKSMRGAGKFCSVKSDH